MADNKEFLDFYKNLQVYLALKDTPDYELSKSELKELKEKLFDYNTEFNKNLNSDKKTSGSIKFDSASRPTRSGGRIKLYKELNDENAALIWIEGLRKHLGLNELDLSNPENIKKHAAILNESINIVKGEKYAEELTEEKGLIDSKLEDVFEDSTFEQNMSTQNSIWSGEVFQKMRGSKFMNYFKTMGGYDFSKENINKVLSDLSPELKKELIATGDIDLEKAETEIIRNMEDPEDYTPGGFVGTVENLAKQFQNGDKTAPLTVEDLHILGDDVRNIELIIDNNVPLVFDITEMKQDSEGNWTKKETTGKDYSSRDNLFNYINGLIKTGNPKGEELLKKFKSTYFTETEKKEGDIINTGKVPTENIDFVPEEYTPLSSGTYTDAEGNLWRKGTEGGWQVKYNKATREKGVPTVDEFGTPSFKMEFDYENDWTTFDKDDPLISNVQDFENQLTPFTGSLENLPSTTETTEDTRTRTQRFGDAGSSLLKGAGAALDAIGGPGAIISYIMGKKGLKEAMKEVKPQASAELSPMFMQHLRQTRELAKKGFHPDQAQKFRKELDGAYQKGLENAVRGSGGQRAKFLAQSGVLDAQRSSALLDYAAKDEELQAKNQEKYEKMMLFKENFDIGQTEKERAEDMERQVANKKAAAGFTAAAFTNLLSGFGRSSLVPNPAQGSTNLYNTIQNWGQTTEE